MSDIRFLRIECEGCDEQLRVPYEHAGGRVRCPKEGCGVVNALPDRDTIELFVAHGVSMSPAEAPPPSP